MRRLWTAEEEFDFEGRFFRIVKGWQQPKPIRKPMPPVMNAGQSPTGARFAARHADIAFQSVNEGDSFEDTRAKFSALRRLAREEFGREIQIWTGCWSVCAPTERAALDYLDRCIRAYGDPGALDSLPKEVLPPLDGTPPEVLERIKLKALAGWGGAHLVGTPDQIVEKLVEFSNAGADGIVVSWVNYLDGIQDWTREILPRLEQAGLRAPAQPI